MEQSQLEENYNHGKKKQSVLLAIPFLRILSSNSTKLSINNHQTKVSFTTIQTELDQTSRSFFCHVTYYSSDPIFHPTQ